MANKVDILGGGEGLLWTAKPAEETDETFYKKMVEVTQSPVLVLMGDFNFLDI